MRPPTDFEILNTIHDLHVDAFTGYDDDEDGRETKIFVPLDIPTVAKRLNTDVDTVFGRLYYHLEPRYGDETQGIAFFRKRVGQSTVNAVNFPLLESVLAGLWVERSRDRRTSWTAVVSIGIALGSLAVSIVSIIVSLTA